VPPARQQHAGSRRPYLGNRVRGFALRREEATRGAAEYFQQVREDVRDRLRPGETDGDINQHRYDTHEGAVQHAPLRRLPRDPYSEYQGCDERRGRCAVQKAFLSRQQAHRYDDAGNYSFAVTGTSGSLSHTATGSLAVQDYILTLSPSLISVTTTSPGNVATFTVTATSVNGYSGTVGLTPQWQNSGPPYIGNNWTPANSVTLDGVHPASTAWVVTNFSGIGTWPLTIYGGSSYCATSPNHCAYSYFNVATQPDFTRGVSPSTLALTPPVNTSPGGYTISLTTLNGSCGTANFSVSSVPTGAFASFNPASVAVPSSGTVTTALSGSRIRKADGGFIDLFYAFRTW
jgi:hypothetical protein